MPVPDADRRLKTTTEVALNGTGLPTRVGDAVVPLFSIDGRPVVFDSSDATLIAGARGRKMKNVTGAEWSLTWGSHYSRN